MESNERPAAAWHVLWSAVGFGSTAAKLVELLQAVKQDDESGDSDMYFPAYMDRTAEGDELMVPLFPNYAFVKCSWHTGLDERIREMSGMSAVFLRMPGMDFPHRLAEEEMDRVKDALQKRIELVDDWVHVEDIAIGDRVKVKNMDIVGVVIHFLPPSRAMIQATFFNAEHSMVAKISDLERL
jgi:transcription antitermination factor NusG